MSHSQFHCTGRVYLDLHGLIFETSICYWQDQPGSPVVFASAPPEPWWCLGRERERWVGATLRALKRRERGRSHVVADRAAAQQQQQPQPGQKQP